MVWLYVIFISVLIFIIVPPILYRVAKWVAYGFFKGMDKAKNERRTTKPYDNENVII